MDTGLPEAKTVRMNSGSWSNGHPEQQPYRRELPPPPYPPPPPQHTYTQPPPHMLSHPQDDRRNREPDYPAPLQDHRPQTGQYHPIPFSGPGPREPMVKREEDPAHLRPHSTGDIHQEYAHPLPPDDQRRQSMGYELNAPPVHGFRPVPQHSISQPPPISMYERPSVDQPPPTPGGSRDAIFPYSSSSSNNQRKKAPRTTHACTQCRQAKGKCDDPKPCSTCREKGLQCDWKTPEPKQGDYYQMKIIGLLEELKKDQHHIKKTQQQDSKRIQKLEKISSKGFSKDDSVTNSDVKSEAEDEEMAEVYNSTPTGHQLSATQPSTPREESYLAHNAYVDVAPSPKGESDEEEAGQQIVPGEPAIPVGHTTGAAKLIRWPSIHALIGDILKEDKIRDNYPSRIEHRHGIRIWGRGPTQAASPESNADNEEFYSPSPSAENVYGQLGGGTPPPYLLRPDLDYKGGPGTDELLNLHPEVVNRLIDNYKNHIHILHPILDLQKLDDFKRLLLNNLPQSAEPPTKPGFLNNHAGEHPSKRQKRSPAESGNTYTNYFVKPGALRPSIATAVILLVLGLGEICEYHGKIPDLVHESDPSYDSSSLQNGYSSPLQASPAISSISSGLPSPQEADRVPRPIRRTSHDGHARYRAGPQKRNMDIIPGMKYVGPATDILGNEKGDYTKIYYVQANILAGLYFGQLARPYKSYAFIHEAATILQNTLKIYPQNFYDLRQKMQYPNPAEKKKNLLTFAFWTTLILESDIVAELDLTHSGITTLEEGMPWPNCEHLSNREAESYNAQLYLRNHLNSIHKSFYESGKEENFVLEKYARLQGSQSNMYMEVQLLLEALPSIKTIAQSFAWGEDKDLATDLLSARLRAKFYGTQVITYRPFLMMLMNRASRFPGEGKRAVNDSLKEEDYPAQVMIYAKACINALINSTRVFYGLPQSERLIITNPWGTAHAQFGNVLVLQTAFHDPLLRPYIDRDDLTSLVRRTMEFLRFIADRDSSLNTDIKILKHLAYKVGIVPDTPSDRSNPASSFSSIPDGGPGEMRHPMQ